MKKIELALFVIIPIAILGFFGYVMYKNSSSSSALIQLLLLDLIIIGITIGAYIFYKKRGKKSITIKKEKPISDKITRDNHLTCSRCNTKNNDDVQFCKQCGNDLKKSKV